jgi:ribose transport system substrate-binding protein
VYYVPITLEDPEFAVISSSLKAALAKVGVSLVTCSANATPTGFAACLDRAVAARVSAIVTDSIPVAEAANAYQKAQSAGIPVLVTDQLVPPAGVPGAVTGLGNQKLGYMPGGAAPLLALVADWVIADSGGKANVLLSEFIDNPTTKAFIEQVAAPEFRHHCPGCTMYFSHVLNANFNLIPSQTSSALLAHPGINYVISEFDAELQPMYGGVQQSGFASKVKAASTTGILGALQQLKSGQFLHADAGIDMAYQGWADADAVLRQLLGMHLVKETIPVRLFTSDNVGSLKLTSAAQASGEWYGSNGYQAVFLKLWGQ